MDIEVLLESFDGAFAPNTLRAYRNLLITGVIGLKVCEASELNCDISIYVCGLALSLCLALWLRLYHELLCSRTEQKPYYRLKRIIECEFFISENQS